MKVGHEWQKPVLCLYLHKFCYEVWISGVVLLTEQNDDQCCNGLEAWAVQRLGSKSSSGEEVMEVSEDDDKVTM